MSPQSGHRCAIRCNADTCICPPCPCPQCQNRAKLARLLELDVRGRRTRQFVQQVLNLRPPE